MQDQNTKVRAMSAPWRQGVEFLVRQGNAVGTNVVMEVRSPAEIHQPTFSLDLDAAQVLMDDLWNAGLRPTEGSGSAGAMRAVERHLEDMRTLVFKKGGGNV